MEEQEATHAPTPEEIEAMQEQYKEEQARCIAKRIAGKQPAVLHPEEDNLPTEAVPFLQKE